MDYEVMENKNVEQETELATYEESEPAEKTGIGFGSILAGAAIVGGAIWGAKKLYKKFRGGDREAEKLEKQAEKLRKKGYHVAKQEECGDVLDAEFEVCDEETDE